MSPGEERRGRPPRFRGGCCTSRAADVIASDRSLRDLAAQRPRNLTQLLDVYGFGETRAERYGPGMLGVVAQFKG